MSLSAARHAPRCPSPSKPYSAFVKFPHHTKSQMLMKMYAVSCQIFIPGLRHSDTRFHILVPIPRSSFSSAATSSCTASLICILCSDIITPRSFFNKYSTKGRKWAIVRARLVLVWAQLPALLMPVNNSIAGTAWAQGYFLAPLKLLVFPFYSPANMLPRPNTAPKKAPLRAPSYPTNS